MADKFITQIKLGGVTYDIKDAALRTEMANGLHYIGITDTSIGDQDTTAEVVVSGSTVSAKQGDIVLTSYVDPNGTTLHREYVWSGSAWDEFGSTGAIGSMAFVESASGTTAKHMHTLNVLDGKTTVAASVTQGTVTGSVSISIPTSGTVSMTAADALTGYDAPTTATVGTASTNKVESTTVEVPNLHTHTTQKLVTTVVTPVSGTTSINTGYQLDASTLKKASIATDYAISEKRSLDTTTIYGVKNGETVTATSPMTFSTTDFVTTVTPTTVATSVTSKSTTLLSGNTVEASKATTATAIGAYTSLTTKSQSDLFNTNSVKGVGTNTVSATYLTGNKDGYSVCDASVYVTTSGSSDYVLDFNQLTSSVVTNIAQPAATATTFLSGLKTSLVTGGTTTAIGQWSFSSVAVPVMETSATSVVTSVSVPESVVTEITPSASAGYSSHTGGSDITVPVATSYVVATGGTTVDNTNGVLASAISSNATSTVLTPDWWKTGDAAADKSGVDIARGISSTGTTNVALSGSNVTLATGKISASGTGDGVIVSSTATTYTKTVAAINGTFDYATIGSETSFITGLGDKTTAKFLTGDTTTYDVTLSNTATTASIDGGTTQGVAATVALSAIASGLETSENSGLSVTVDPNI